MTVPMNIALYMGARDNVPKPVTVTWDELVEALRTPRRTSCTVTTCVGSKCSHKDGPAWSPANYIPGTTRNNANVLTHSCAIADWDHATNFSPLANLKGVRRIIHASHSDRIGDRCARVIVALSRPVTVVELSRFRTALAKAFGAAGIEIDPATKDAARLYYLPSRPSDADYFFESHDGAPLDVDLLLSSLPDGVAFVPPVPAEMPRTWRDTACVLGSAWPSSSRHVAHLALAGALAREGWSAADIADYAVAVAETQQPGNGDYTKRLEVAERAVAMVTGGENVTGWPSLAACVGRSTVSQVKELLGLPPLFVTPADNLAFEEAVRSFVHATPATVPQQQQAASAAPAAQAVSISIPEPLEIDIDARIQSGEKRLASRTDAASMRDREYLRRVRNGEQLTSQPHENQLAALRAAALAVARIAPPGTSPQQLARRLQLSTNVELQPWLVGVAQEALVFAPQLPSLLVPIRPRASKDKPVASAEGEFELDLKGNREGRPTNNSGKNMRLALAKIGVALRFNELAACEEISIPPGVVKGLPGGCQHVVLQDNHVRQIRDHMEATFDLKPPKDELHDLIKVVALEDSYHPVREYLDALPMWDGTSRVEEWLISAGAPDTPYVRAISRLVLVAAVRRARRPGCLFQEMLIIEGPQGRGKSTALQALVPEKAWFTDNFEFDTDQRKMIEATEGKWIVEAGELSKMTKNDHKELKRYLASTRDKARMAYARITEERPRQFVLIGTTNDGEYLEDLTGNRRYWPVEVIEFDPLALAAIREQLWAEASLLDLEHPEDSYIRLDPSLYEAAGVEQEKRRAKAPIEVLLTDALENLVGRIKLADVWELAGIDLVGRKKPSNPESREINAVMRKLGWDPAKLVFGAVSKNAFVKGTEAEREITLGVSNGVVGRAYGPANSGSVIGIPLAN